MREDPESVKAKIIEAFIMEFNADGTKLNLDNVAKRIHISKKTIYRYFSSKTDIPLGYYFNACIQLGNEEAKLYCVVKIIRREIRQDGTIFYGCEMVGLAPVFTYIFEEYESSLSEEDLKF